MTMRTTESLVIEESPDILADDSIPRARDTEIAQRVREIQSERTAERVPNRSPETFSRTPLDKD